jgi:hypothetical protein
MNLSASEAQQIKSNVFYMNKEKAEFDPSRNLGTANFSNILHSINNEEVAKSFQIESQNDQKFINETSELQTDRICYTMREMDEEDTSVISNSV